jgi:hypothetical protein
MRLFLVLAMLDSPDEDILSDIIEICTEEHDAQRIVKEIQEGTYIYQAGLPLWNEVRYIIRRTNDPSVWKSKIKRTERDTLLDQR